jgi:hypothetical protein
MSSQISIFNTFQDLKLKGSDGGGLSDGGIVSKSQTLKTGAPVTIAPPKGVNWGPLNIAPYQQGGGNQTPGGAIIVNFDLTATANVEEYLVLEDGSEVLINTRAQPPESAGPAGDFFLFGGIVNHPNKIRYKLVQSGINPLPTKRVLIKYALVEYDQTPV